MNVSSPLPTYLVGLLLMLPGVALAGRELAAWVTRALLLRQALAPGLALALWLVAVHASGLATHGFVPGLEIGTVAVGIGGFAAYAARRGPRRAERARGAGIAAVGWASILLSAVPIAWIAFGWAFHDEDLFTGHMSIASEMQNGVYPPRHLTFADTELHYHYGFDLLVACVTALTRARVDVAIDLATVLLWLLSATMLWAIGAAWFRRGWLALVLVSLAGGPPCCLFARASARALPGLCPMKAPGSMPPFISSFFQHPWALGVPLALALLLCASARDRERGRARLVATFVLFVALALGHAVLFLAVASSLFVAEIVCAARAEERRRSRAAIPFAAALSLVAAPLLHVAPWAVGGGGGDALRLAHVRTVAEVVEWHVQNYGALLLLSAFGLSRLPRRVRLVVALLIAGGLLLVNSVRYVYSDDILKLGIVAQIAMAVAASSAIARWLDRLRFHTARYRAFGRVSATGAIALASAGGLTFASLFFTGRADRYFARSVARMEAEDQACASFIRARVRPSEIVYRRRDRAAGYAEWAGLPSVWHDWGTLTFGFPAARLTARSELLVEMPSEVAPWLAQGVRWFVVDSTDARMSAIVDAWVADGIATVELRSEALRVARIRGGPSSGGRSAADGAAAFR